MVELMQAYQAFWEEAGIPAFPQNNVPNEDIYGNPVTMPYITYTYAATDYFDSTIIQSIIWTSAAASLRQLSEISAKIFEMIPATTGRTLILPNGKGAVRLYRGTPFMQDYPQEERDIKANYFVVEVKTHIL